MKITIRLDPEFCHAYFSRSLTQMLKRRPESAARGFRRVLEIQKWKGERAPYAVILGHIAAQQAGDVSGAKQFLKGSTGILMESWPYPVVKFLRGQIDEAALLMLAADRDKRTEAHCYLGLDSALKGTRDKTLVHFRWVKEHGNPAFFEYSIALAELDRLELSATVR